MEAADDEFDISESEFDARMKAAHPARLRSRDDRLSRHGVQPTASPSRFEQNSAQRPFGSVSLTVSIDMHALPKVTR